MYYRARVADDDFESAWSGYVDLVVSISHLLSTVNSSINFVIYCYKDSKFREGLVTHTCPTPPMINAAGTNGAVTETHV